MTRQRDLRQASSALFGVPWALRESKLAEIVGAFDAIREGKSADFRMVRQELEARRGESATESGDKPYRIEGKVAVIPIVGTLHNRVGFFEAMSGGASAQTIDHRIRAALADDDVAGIVLDVDSPGGSVLGPGMVAETIFGARGKKPVWAVANDMAASAAYLIASAAEKVIVSASSLVGSIGVYCVHEDWSRAEQNAGVKVTTIKAGRWKAVGSPHEPLSDDARSALQSQVDEYYAIFVSAVAKHRGISAEVVRDRIAEGREWIGRQAIDVGAADEIGTLTGAIGRLNTMASQNVVATGKGAAMSEANKAGEVVDPQAASEAILGSVERIDMAAITEAARADERERAEQIDAMLELSRIDASQARELRKELVGGGASLAEARKAIAAAVKQSHAAIGDGGAARAIGRPGDPDAEARIEYDRHRATFEKMGVTLENYIATRRDDPIPEGLRPAAA